MLNATLNALNTHLKQKGFTTQLPANENQIYFSHQIEEVDYPTFVRVYPDGELIQLLLFFPVEMKEGTEPHLARLLHLLNKQLDIPGFGMDEESRMMFFRFMLPTQNKKCSGEVFDNLIDMLKNVAGTFSPVINAVAFHEVTFDEVLEKIEKAEAPL